MRRRIDRSFTGQIAVSCVVMMHAVSACGTSSSTDPAAAGNSGSPASGSSSGGSSAAGGSSAGGPPAAGTGGGGASGGGASGGSGGADNAFPLHIPLQRQLAAGNLVTCAAGLNAVTCWGGMNKSPSQPLTGAYQNLALGSFFGVQPICGIASGGATNCADSEGQGAVDVVTACLPKTPLIDIAFDRKSDYTALVSQTGQAHVFASPSCGSGAVPAAVSNIKRIVSADKHACALDSQGKAYCWTSNFPDMLEPVLTDQFVDISAGSVSACAINMAGKVRCWDSTGKEDQSTSGFAYQISGAADSPPVVQLASDGSSRNLCALFNDGRVLCSQQFKSGLSASFQLPKGERVTEIAVGDSHVCGVRSDGSVLCLPLGCTPDCTARIAAPAGFKVVR